MVQKPILRLEVELELIHTSMAQKPLLWVEEVRVRRAKGQDGAWWDVTGGVKVRARAFV